MVHKYLTSEEIRKEIVRMRNAGVADADSEKLRVLRKELKVSMLDASAPPSPRAPVSASPRARVRDCISDDFL